MCQWLCDLHLWKNISKSSRILSTASSLCVCLFSLNLSLKLQIDVSSAQSLLYVDIWDLKPNRSNLNSSALSNFLRRMLVPFFSFSTTDLKVMLEGRLSFSHTHNLSGHLVDFHFKIPPGVPHLDMTDEFVLDSHTFCIENFLCMKTQEKYL